MNASDRIAQAVRMKRVTIELNFFSQPLSDAFPDPKLAFRDMPTPDRNGDVANFFRFEIFGKIMQLANRESHAIRVDESVAEDRAEMQRHMKCVLKQFTQAFNTIEQSYVMDGTKHISFVIHTSQNADRVARQMVDAIAGICSLLITDLEKSADAYEQWLLTVCRSLIGCTLDMTFTGPTKFNYMSVCVKDA